MSQVVGEILVVSGVLALAMNGFLILTSLGIIRRKLEVDLAIVLAVVDMGLALLSAAATFLMVSSGFDPRVMELICRVKGPFDFLGLYLSMMLVALIGRIRYSRVFDVCISRRFWIFLSLATLLYTVLTLACLINDEFAKSPSGIDCAPDALKSVWARLLILFNGVALLVFLLMTLSCYLRITFAAAQTPPRGECFVEMKAGCLAGEDPPPTLLKRARVAIRPLTISATYFILIAPSCLLIVFEAAFQGDTLLKHTSLIISICLTNISLANPILVLFAHSVIYNTAKQRCKSFVDHITSRKKRIQTQPPFLK